MCINCISGCIHSGFTRLIGAGAVAGVVVGQDRDAGRLEGFQVGADHAEVGAIAMAVEQ